MKSLEIDASEHSDFTCRSSLLTSCLMGLILVATSASIAGRFSALTYQVIGQMKGIGTFVVAVALFNEEIGLRSALGVVLAALGCLAYARSK